MKMAKKQFRIGELAKRLAVERFVIRFWEKEFELSASRSSGKQRFYSEEDYATFSTIKQLLYNEKFTISGAKKQLASEKKSISSTKNISKNMTKIDTSEETNSQNHTPAQLYVENKTLTNQMLQLREKLIKLNELL